MNYSLFMVAELRLRAFSVYIGPFDGVKSVQLQGAARSGLIGQASERGRWADLPHLRGGFRILLALLHSACGQLDNGAKCASPANAKKRSNDPI